MKTPVIGVMLSESRSQMPGAIHKMQHVNSAYLHAVEQAGGIPIGLPLVEDSEKFDRLLNLCDGFLLPGGADVDPHFYGQEPHPLLGRVNLVEDEIWAKVVFHSIETKKPLLAVCRGMQLLNTALGGTLYQDLSDFPAPTLLHRQSFQDRDYPMHKITLEGNSRLAAVLGTSEVCTNTLHHQCVDRCGEGLTVSAHTEDGVIEAVESRDGLLLAVQWHPEELQETVPCMKNLFSDLISRAQI